MTRARARQPSARRSRALCAGRGSNPRQKRPPSASAACGPDSAPDQLSAARPSSNWPVAQTVHQTSGVQPRGRTRDKLDRYGCLITHWPLPRPARPRSARAAPIRVACSWRRAGGAGARARNQGGGVQAGRGAADGRSLQRAEPIEQTARASAAPKRSEAAREDAGRAQQRPAARRRRSALRPIRPGARGVCSRARGGPRGGARGGQGGARLRQGRRTAAAAGGNGRASR
eukprot:5313570-Prymnesium_polylepis.1